MVRCDRIPKYPVKQTSKASFSVDDSYKTEEKTSQWCSWSP